MSFGTDARPSETLKAAFRRLEDPILPDHEPGRVRRRLTVSSKRPLMNRTACKSYTEIFKRRESAVVRDVGGLTYREIGEELCKQRLRESSN